MCLGKSLNNRVSIRVISKSIDNKPNTIYNCKNNNYINLNN